MERSVLLCLCFVAVFGYLPTGECVMCSVFVDIVLCGLQLIAL